MQTHRIPRRIRVNEHYRGISSTGGQLIKPGEYLVTDPALFNQAGFLVKTGRAEVTEWQTINVARKGADMTDETFETGREQGESGADVDAFGDPTHEGAAGPTLVQPEPIVQPGAGDGPSPKISHVRAGNDYDNWTDEELTQECKVRGCWPNTGPEPTRVEKIGLLREADDPALIHPEMAGTGYQLPDGDTRFLNRPTPDLPYEDWDDAALLELVNAREFNDVDLSAEDWRGPVIERLRQWDAENEEIEARLGGDDEIPDAERLDADYTKAELDEMAESMGVVTTGFKNKPDYTKALADYLKENPAAWAKYRRAQ